MLFFLYFMWFVFNGSITVEIAVIGAVVCLFLYAFICRFLGYSPKKDIFAVGLILKCLKYLAILFISIVKSNMDVIKIILSPHEKSPSILISFKSEVKDFNKRCILANSITITPGTFTVNMKGRDFTVHCLTEDFAKEIINSKFEKELKKMEEKC